MNHDLRRCLDDWDDFVIHDRGPRPTALPRSIGEVAAFKK